MFDMLKERSSKLKDSNKKLHEIVTEALKMRDQMKKRHTERKDRDQFIDELKTKIRTGDETILQLKGSKP
jgi:predicted nuclease with TOPRIM domain